MKIDRLQRVNELLRREIGGLILEIMRAGAFDVAAVTVTHVITSSDLRSARVLVSIRNHARERPAMLHQLQHHHAEFQRRVADSVILKYTPRLQFELDHSLENGDRILDLLAHLGPDAPPPSPRKD